jgi:hypothetical protein
MIMICAATGAEASACKKGIEAAGAISKSFEVLHTGMGMKAARTRLAERLAALEVVRQTPKLIISSGFAGVWRGSLEIGAWVGASEFWKEERDGSAATFSKVGHPSVWTPEGVDTLCPIVSVDVIQKLPSLPEAISTGSLCVDMETAGLAQVAREKGIPFGVLRMITDTSEQPLPEFVSIFAQAIHSPELGDKVKLSGKGLQQVVADPLSVARFLKSGKKWSDWLARGWQERAEAIASSISTVPQ